MQVRLRLQGDSNESRIPNANFRTKEIELYSNQTTGKFQYIIIVKVYVFINVNCILPGKKLPLVHGTVSPIPIQQNKQESPW